MPSAWKGALVVATLLSAFSTLERAFDVYPVERFGVFFGLFVWRLEEKNEGHDPQHAKGAQFGEIARELLVTQGSESKHMLLVLKRRVERAQGKDPGKRQEGRRKRLSKEVGPFSERSQRSNPRDSVNNGEPEYETGQQGEKNHYRISEMALTGPSHCKWQSGETKEKRGGDERSNWRDDSRDHCIDDGWSSEPSHDHFWESNEEKWRSHENQYLSLED